jgi:hypothetical protein
LAQLLQAAEKVFALKGRGFRGAEKTVLLKGAASAVPQARFYFPRGFSR